jgi:WD40 repeat protein
MTTLSKVPNLLGDLTVAVYDIGHKAAEAYDLREDFINWRVVEWHSGSVNALSVFGRVMVISASTDKSIKLWDAQTCGLFERFGVIQQVYSMWQLLIILNLSRHQRTTTQ